MAGLGTTLQVARRAAVVGACCGWERFFGSRAVAAGDVPGSAREITAEWLTAVLCAGVPGGRVLGVAMTGGSSGTSERQGLALMLNEAAKEGGVPERLFTKATATFRQRLFLGLVGIIGGEAGFYPQIRPGLKIEAPVGYHACVDARSWRSMVLLEDLVAGKGATFISSETYFTKEMMFQVLGDMAVWHGAYWESPELNGRLAWLRTPDAFMVGLGRLVAFKERCRMGEGIAASVVPAGLVGQSDRVFEAMRGVQAARGPQCFLHGDPHVGQVYVTRDGRVGIGDWQIVMRGSWAHDYTYAVTTALTVADRRAWERELLEFYVERLAEAGGARLGFDAAWESYRRNIAYGYCAWLFTVVGASEANTPEMQPRQVCLDIIGRTGQALVDLGV